MYTGLFDSRALSTSNSHTALTGGYKRNESTYIEHFPFASYCASCGLSIWFSSQSSGRIAEAAQWPGQSDSRAQAFEKNALLWISSS